MVELWLGWGFDKNGQYPRGFSDELSKFTRKNGKMSDIDQKGGMPLSKTILGPLSKRLFVFGNSRCLYLMDYYHLDSLDAFV